MPRKGNVVKVSKSSQRAARRKAGWKEVGEAAKGLLIDDPKSLIVAGGKEVRDAANKGYGVASVGGLITGAVKQAVRNVPTNIGRVGKVVKGTLKGIFNHPSWYAYKGQLSVPAHNIMRPFTPKSLKSILKPSVFGTQYDAASFGVTHYVQVNLKYNDQSASEAFKLATIEAFKAIRLDLKSNLPYTQEAYDNYINMVCSIFVKAKAIEKALGMYNYTRADMPEFTRASQTVPFNIGELGIVTPTAISMLSDSNYATTLNNFKKLKSIINNIAIPRKLAEYLAWWVGSNFIDQAAPNPQIYATMLREAYIYEATSVTQVDIVSSWDMATGSVQDVIDEALNLLNVFGIMNADITKTGRYGTCDIVLPEVYSPIFLNDPEFFSILINAYPNAHGTGVLASTVNEDYIRVDALEELNDVNLVGMANALSKWANYPTLLTIESEACYMDVDSSMAMPSGGSTGSTTNWNLGATEANGAWIQISAAAQLRSTIGVSATASNVTGDFDANTRLDSIILAAASAARLYLPFNNGSIDRRSSNLVIATGVNSSSHTIQLRIPKGGSDLVIYDVTAGTAIATITGFTGSISWTGVNYKINDGYFTLSNLTDALVPYLPDGTISYTNAFARVTYATSSGTSFYGSFDPKTFIAWFCELVDYHLPIMVEDAPKIEYNGSWFGTIYQVPTLLKECYKPMLFNLADISTVLYWMYLGLFSMD